MAELTERQQDLKAEFIAHRGFWEDTGARLLELDPNFFEGYMKLSTAAAKGGALDEKTRELICIAVDASVNHLFERGIKLHMQKAMEAGASRREVMEVLEIVSCLSIHTCTVGVPLMMEVFGNGGESEE